jgi:hypothetical protein
LASKAQQAAQADALLDRFMAVEADGSLAQRVRMWWPTTAAGRKRRKPLDVGQSTPMR